MIGFWTPHLLFFKSNDTNNNDNHSNHNRHHVFPHDHGDRCVPVTFDISSPQNFESSKNSSSTAHYHRRHNDGFRLAAAAVAAVIFFLVTASPTLAWVSTPSTTMFQHSLRTTTPFHHHRHSFTRDSSLGATTADSTATMENLMTKNAVMPVSPLSQQQQQQQSILLSPPPQLTTTASWLFAPTVLSLLAVPSSASAAAASSRIQEAWDNVIGATLPESTPDLISVIVGEGMGYLTYFGVTAFLVASVWQNHQQQQQQQQQQQHDAEDVIVEYDEEDDSLDDPMLMMVSSSSLLTTTDNDHHVMLFEPVSSTEEDALVPCAFLLEQAQALEQQQTQTHQSLLHHLDWVEVFFDVTKWLSYFVLQSDLRGTLLLFDGNNILLENAVFGFVAGFGAKFYADVLYRHLGQGPAHKRQEMTQQPWPLACLMEGVSAASLFAAYEAVQEPVQDLVQWWSTVYTHLGHLDCSMWL